MTRRARFSSRFYLHLENFHLHLHCLCYVYKFSLFPFFTEINPSSSSDGLWLASFINGVEGFLLFSLHSHDFSTKLFNLYYWITLYIRSFHVWVWWWWQIALMFIFVLFGFLFQIRFLYHCIYWTQVFWLIVVLIWFCKTGNFIFH